MKQVEVTILGQGYILGCPDGGEALLHTAVTKVDGEMSAIRDAGKVKARERIAVLTALNLAYQRAEQAHAIAHAPAPKPAAAMAVADGEMDVEHLIRRIDSVLGPDGQLL
jgi:cell division protein ZapA